MMKNQIEIYHMQAKTRLSLLLTMMMVMIMN